MTETELSKERSIRWNIPIAIVLGALLQAAGAIWWASTVESRLDQLKIRQLEFTTHLDASMADRVLSGERLAKVEQMSADIIEWLRRIDSKIDRIPANH